MRLRDAGFPVYMPSHNNFSSRSSHTVVLQPRGNSASQTQKYGSKQRQYSYARGSPPQIAPSAPRGQTSNPTRPAPRRRNIEENNYRNPVDLLARFGIDTFLGRVVTRVLILFMLTQPVYVALGMEIEEPGAEENVPEVKEISEDTITVEDVVEINEQNNEINAPESSEENTEVVETAENEEAEVNEEDGDDTFDVDTDVDTDVETTEEETQESEEEVTDESKVDTSNETPLDSTDSANPDSNGAGNSEDTNTDEEDTSDESTETDEGVTEEDGTTSGGGGGGSSSNVDEETQDTTEGDTTEDVASSTDETASSTDETASSTDETTEDTSEEDATDSETASTTASTTQEKEEVVLNVAQNPDSKYIFGEGDCTLVSDGEFYCVTEGPETQQMTGDERVYAEKDREGDKEIFYFDGIDVQRITNNSYDDFAPMYDEETKYIVWQSMIQDRLQIMVHEVETKTTRQVTTSRQNSSNPSISGHTVVWQEWIDTNWEIMMTDVDNGGQKFEIERLTDNAVHDMFPAAYEDLITWQSERGSSWEVVVYDLHTGKQTLIEKDEDTKYENPRFVLLFDSKHENGDVETIGYDLDTGEMMELGTRSQPIPLEPLTPKDETPEALLREASTSTQIKVEETDDEEDAADDVVVM